MFIQQNFFSLPLQPLRDFPADLGILFIITDGFFDLFRSIALHNSSNYTLCCFPEIWFPFLWVHTKIIYLTMRSV